jgi:hypothetical protein
MWDMQGFFQQDGTIAIRQTDIQANDIGTPTVELLAGFCQGSRMQNLVASAGQERGNIYARVFLVIYN